MKTVRRPIFLADVEETADYLLDRLCEGAPKLDSQAVSADLRQ